MFTGLVAGEGKIQGVEPRGKETRLTIQALFDLPNIVLGESIAVNGVCLTVETFGANVFTAYASRETMSVTNLGKLRPGSKANLERALAVGDRLGGHLVSGHVDCIAKVASITLEGESKIFKLSYPAEYGVLVVEKGSVCLDGISLTVNSCGPDWLSVNIIPATQRETSISDWSVGYEVNMETDIIGRYVQRMMGAYTGGGDSKPSSGGLDMDFLSKHGF